MTIHRIDKWSFELGKKVGAINAWCEAARTGAKGMSLSSPFKPEEYDLLTPYIKEIAERNEVKYYLEKELMTTDLFADIDMTGLWVYVIYKEDRTLEEYLSLKNEKNRLEKASEYVGAIRHEIAISMGELLGYKKEYAAKRIERVKAEQDS